MMEGSSKPVTEGRAWVVADPGCEPLALIRLRSDASIE